MLPGPFKKGGWDDDETNGPGGEGVMLIDS
jgi:hypothetical protein